MTLRSERFEARSSKIEVYEGHPLMTAPFNPHPHPLIWAFVVGLAVVVMASPFGRRDDWLGWISLLAVAAAAVFMWATLISGLAMQIAKWFKNKR